MKTIVLAAAAVLLLAGAAYSEHAEAQSEGPAGAFVIPLEQFRKSVAIRAEVAGRERLFMFDTGGGVTFISPEMADELKCDRGAKLIGFRMTGDRMETPRCDNVEMTIAGARFTAPVAGVYQVGEFAAKGVKVDGLIALDIFADRVVTLDFASRRLILESPQGAAARERAGKELPARLARENGGRAIAAYVDVPSPNGPLAFELDSGNGGTLLIGKTYAASFGFDPDKGPRLGSFEVSPGITASGLVMPANITLDGNLGMPFLKDYLVTLDLRHGRVWLARNPVPAPPGMGTPPEAPPPGK